MATDDVSPPLAELSRQLATCRQEARELVRDLSPDALLWRPDPKSWSIAHCLVHVADTTAVYARTMDRGIERGRAAGLEGDGTAWNAFERWFARFLEPPPRLEVPAPRKLVPEARVTGAEAMARYEASHERLDGLIEASRGLDLARVKVDHPFLPLLKLRLGATFGILAAHERRHLWQMANLVAAPGFPG